MKLRSGSRTGKDVVYHTVEQRLTTFHPFSKLPVELRTKIWKLTILPRVMRYKTSNRVCKRTVNPVKTPVPALLHVCSESRGVGLENYKLTKYYVKDRTPLYFNVKTDILLLGGDFRYLGDLVGNLKIPDPILMQIRYLAVGIWGWESILPLVGPNRFFVPTAVEVYEKIRQSKALEELILLDSTEVEGGAWELSLVERNLSGLCQREIKKPEWNELEIKFAILEKKAQV